MAEDAPESPRRPSQHRRRAGIAGTGALLIVMAILLPAAAISASREIVRPSPTQVHQLTPARGPATDLDRRTTLQIVLESLLPWDGTIRLRVAAHRSCASGCGTAMRVLFVAIPSQRQDNLLPVAETLNIPTGVGDVNQSLTLPIDGEWIDYPFDRYRLVLGIAAQRLRPDGSVELVPSQTATDELMVTLQERLSEISLAPPVLLDPQSSAPRSSGYAFATLTQLDLRRPVYEQASTGAVVLLAIAAAAFGVLLRPFRDLAVGATTLTLSLWGIRSLLLGQQPGITSVDIILIGVIIFVLCGIAVRVLMAFVRGTWEA